MADTIKDFAEIPQSFFKESAQFMNRCTKPNQKGQSLTYYKEYPNAPMY